MDLKDMRVTEEELNKMNTLLRSPNAPKVMFLMLRRFVGGSAENAELVKSVLTSNGVTGADLDGYQ